MKASAERGGPAVMRCVGIIPARGGSKGIPRKNIRPLNGIPLIVHTIRAAQRSRLSRLVVSTDDPEIAAVSREAGAEVVMRPPELARDDTPTLPVLRHAAEALGHMFDSVMTLQPTSPLRTTRNIDEALEAMANRPEADSLVSVVRVPHNYVPNSLMCRNGDWIVHHQPEGESVALRRQDKQEYLARNGAAVYLTRYARLPYYVVGGKILPYLMPWWQSVDVDTFDDWALAELILRHRHELPPE